MDLNTEAPPQDAEPAEAGEGSTQFTFVLNQGQPGVRSHAMREYWKQRRRLSQNQERRSLTHRTRPLLPSAGSSSSGSIPHDRADLTPLPYDEAEGSQASAHPTHRRRGRNKRPQQGGSVSSSGSEHQLDAVVRRQVGPASADGIPSQVLTGMNHALAGCRLDPFNMFPVHLTAQHHRLLHHWLSSYATMMFEQLPADAFNPMRDVWFPLDLSNAASFNAIMAHSAAHLARLNGIKVSNEAVRYKAEALRIVRLWMEDPGRALSDEVFAAVIRLLTFERYWGTEAEWRVHRDGLQHMIEARGGIASLHSNWRLELVTYLVSLMSKPSWFDSSNNLMEISEQPISPNPQSVNGNEHLRRVRGLWLLSFIQDMRTFLVDSHQGGSRSLRQYGGVQKATFILHADMKRSALDRRLSGESERCTTAEFHRLACIFFICILLQMPWCEPSFSVDSGISSISSSLSSSVISSSNSEDGTVLPSPTKNGLALMDAFLQSFHGPTESVEDLYTRLFYQFGELPDIGQKTKYAWQMTHVLASLSTEARRGVERCLLRIMCQVAGGDGPGGADDYGRPLEEQWTPDDLLSSIRGQ